MSCTWRQQLWYERERFAGLLESTSKTLSADLPKVYDREPEGKAVGRFTTNNANQSVKLSSIADIISRRVSCPYTSAFGQTKHRHLLPVLGWTLIMTSLMDATSILCCRMQSSRHRSLDPSSSGLSGTRSSAYAALSLLLAASSLHSHACMHHRPPTLLMLKVGV